MLREPPLKWCRVGELAWDSRFTLSDERLYAALSEQPVLLERPIFARGPWAVVGRPPEIVLSLLGSDLPEDACAVATWYKVTQTDASGCQVRLVHVPSWEGARLLADHYETTANRCYVCPLHVPGPMAIRSHAVLKE